MHKSTQLYTTIHNFTHNYNPTNLLHTKSTTLYESLKDSTQLYTTNTTNSAKLEQHNKYRQLDATLQNITKLHNALHNTTQLCFFNNFYKTI